MIKKGNPKHGEYYDKACVLKQPLFLSRNLPFTKSAKETQWLTGEVLCLINHSMAILIMVPAYLAKCLFT